MIDEDRTMQLYGYTSDELPPGSHKRVVSVCDVCGRYKVHQMRHCGACCPPFEDWWRKVDYLRKSDDTLCKAEDEYDAYKWAGAKGFGMSKEWYEDFQKDRVRSVTEDEYDAYKWAESAAFRKKYGTNERYYDMFPNMKRDYEMGLLDVKKTAEALGVSRTSIYNTVKDRSSNKISPGQRASAFVQGIPLSEWKGYATESPYCEKFNESCRERNREKYGRRCFLCGKDETDNGRKLSVHHVDRDKDQGCNDHDWSLVPLCKHHHATSHNDLWEARIVYLLDRVWLATL